MRDKGAIHDNCAKKLALRKVQLTGNYNTAQMERTLLKGIEEREHVWDLM